MKDKTVHLIHYITRVDVLELSLVLSSFPSDLSCWWRRSEHLPVAGRTRTFSGWKWSGWCLCLELVLWGGIPLLRQEWSNLNPQADALQRHTCMCHGSQPERGPTHSSGHPQPAHCRAPPQLPLLLHGCLVPTSHVPLPYDWKGLWGISWIVASPVKKHKKQKTKTCISKQKIHFVGYGALTDH